MKNVPCFSFLLFPDDPIQQANLLSVHLKHKIPVLIFYNSFSVRSNSHVILLSGITILLSARRAEKQNTANVILAVETISPEIYEVNFERSNFSSGVYFYSLVAGGNIIDTKIMILVK